MVYIIVGIIVLALLVQAITIPVFLPSILWALILLTIPVICCLLFMFLLVKPAENKAQQRRSAVLNKYYPMLQAAQEEDKRIQKANDLNEKKRQKEKIDRYNAEKQPIEEELNAHKARLNQINVIGTNPKTVEYLQTLIGYMESMRADSIKEAINLAVSENRIRSEQLVRQFQEDMRAQENRRMQEQLLDEARRTRRAEEARAAEAKKASDSLDKIQRDIDYELTYGKRP